MAELVKETLEQIPLFLNNFAKIVSQPVAFAREIFDKATAKTIGTTKLNESLIFFGVCLVVTCVLKASVFGLGASGPEGHAEMSTLYLAKDALWKAFLVMAVAGVMRLSWRLVGGSAPYTKYVILNSYFFGVMYVVTHLILLVATFAFGRPSVWSIVTTLGFVLLAFVPSVVWGLIAWKAYGEINSAPHRKSVLALLLLGLFSAPVVVFSYALRFVLIGHVFRDFI
jgi:hypothetical protein